jgi:hypothetical protein
MKENESSKEGQQRRASRGGRDENGQKSRAKKSRRAKPEKVNREGAQEREG